MDTFLSLVVLAACVCVWYFIKKKPNKRNRNISILIALISFVVFGLFYNKDDYNSKNSSTSQSSGKLSEYKQKDQASSSKKEISITTDSSFETDDEGNAVINGKTEPNSKIVIGMGVLNDAVESDSEGNFSINYKLTKDKEEAIQLTASKDNASGSVETTIIPSANYSAQIQAQASAEAVSSIMQLQENPTTNQEVILDSLRDQQFKQEYPYKGSKIKTVLGYIQPWTVNDGKWYYKAECMIVNAFGAERNANIEVHITPTSESSGNVELIVY